MAKPKEPIYEIIGNKSKIKVLNAILEGPLSVNKIVNLTKIEQTNVSHTLGSLRAMNVVNQRVVGRNHEYFINEDVLPFLKKILGDIKKNEELLKKTGLLVTFAFITFRLISSGEVSAIINTSYQFAQNNYIYITSLFA